MQELLPDIRQLSDFYVFQQDSEPARNLKIYKVWSVMQEKVYKKWIKDVNELRLRILTAWDELDQHVIVLLVRQSDSGTPVCTHGKVKGGHFEHKLSQ